MVRAVRDSVPALTLFQSPILESVTWDRKLCELVLSSLIQRISRTADQCNFSITFFPSLSLSLSFSLSSPPQLRVSAPVLAGSWCASQRPQKRSSDARRDTRIHIHSISFKEKKKQKQRNASSIWYAPFYPLHRPDNVSQRRNLTSSRLDPCEQRSRTAHTGCPAVFSLSPVQQ